MAKTPEHPIIVSIALLFDAAAGFLLAREAILKQKDLDELAEELKALKDPALATLTFEDEGIEIKPGPNAEFTLKRIDTKRHQRRARLGLAFFILGILTHLITEWIG